MRVLNKEVHFTAAYDSVKQKTNIHHTEEKVQTLWPDMKLNL